MTDIMMNPSEIYALRNTNLLELPSIMMDIISTMQLTPVAQIYTKKPGYRKHTFAGPPADRTSSWRADTLTQYKKLDLKAADPEFGSVMALCNKVSTSTVGFAASEIVKIIRSRDQDFRLKIVAMMFNRGVSMPFFSKLVANLFELLHRDIAEIKEDLHFSCSIDIFNKMFDMGDTIVCPSTMDTEYDDKLCEWTKKKEIRRGFGMFVTELHIRNLVDEDIIVGAMKMASDELIDLVRKPVDLRISESVDQLVTLLFETCKIIITRYGKEHPIVKLLGDTTKTILTIPKSNAPCLGMRSKFKLEDILKL